MPPCTGNLHLSLPTAPGGPGPHDGPVMQTRSLPQILTASFAAGHGSVHMAAGVLVLRLVQPLGPVHGQQSLLRLQNPTQHHTHACKARNLSSRLTGAAGCSDTTLPTGGSTPLGPALIGSNTNIEMKPSQSHIQQAQHVPGPPVDRSRLHQKGHRRQW